VVKLPLKVVLGQSSPCIRFERLRIGANRFSHKVNFRVRIVGDARLLSMRGMGESGPVTKAAGVAE
jgi:hypothetical protein